MLSFTKNAAENVKIASQKMLEGTEATTIGVTCATFHSFCGLVLRQHIHLIEPLADFSIADENDQIKIVSSLLDHKEGIATATEILKQIRLWKEQGLGYLGIKKKALDSTRVSKIEQIAYDLYPLYMLRLRSMNVLDFGDLLIFTLRLFRDKPEILDIYRSRYKHIIVDEFQDISPAQYDILRLLVVNAPFKIHHQDMLVNPSKAEGNVMSALHSNEYIENRDLKTPNNFQISVPYIASAISKTRFPHHQVNIFCAGDDDQSIYSFRGGRVEYMRKFRFDFPSAKLYQFKFCYRLPETILKTAVSIVHSIPGHINKPMTTFQRDHIDLGTKNEYILKSTSLAPVPPPQKFCIVFLCPWSLGREVV